MRSILLLFSSLFVAAAFAAPGSMPARAPEFTHTEASSWINSAPLTIESLRGEVVLIEFWTFGCINCRRSLPWLKAAHEKYSRAGLTIVSVHTPEFAYERDLKNVRMAVQREGIRYPVMVDGDHSYWNAFANRFWPAFYLVGRDGRVTATAVGELHRDTARGDDFESRIEKLLSER